MLLINGDRFFFKDDGFSLEQKSNLQNVADLVSQKSLQQKISKEDFYEINEEELCLCFINEVKASLEIDLLPVKVSFIVRIKY